MDIEAVVAQINEQAGQADPIGDTIKFKIDEHVLFVDGTGPKNIVSTEDKEASCTITTSKETMIALKNGDLNPMMAVMGGKVKISGDMGLAMKLQSLL